jgi:DHA2 family multidrug resistance protein-like MFS transporter
MRAKRWWALGSLALAVLAVGLDATILSVALPTLGRSLHASTGQLQWFVAGYTLVFAAALVPGGMLADRYGRKRMLLLSLLLFGAASIACALASSAAELIAARAFLGLGAALMLPTVLGLLPVLFEEGERTRAIGAITAAVMLGYPIGPLLGGWMLTRFHWGWVFLINVPVVVLALVAVAVLLPESRSSIRRRIDLVGVALSSGGLALLTYGVIAAGGRGWSDSSAIAEMAVGTLALVAFVVYEHRVAEPLVDLRLFRARAFTWGATLSSLVSFAMFGLLFAIPLYFQVVRGADAQGSGIRLLPLIAGLILGGAVADRLVARAGAGVTAALGLFLFAAGLAVGATTTVATGDLQAVVWIALSGIGLGLALPTTIDAALGQVSEDNSGVASGVLQALRMVGGALGAAILGALINAGYRDQLEQTVPPALARSARESAVVGVDAAQAAHSARLLDAVRDAFVGGMTLTLWVCAALMVVGGLVALAFGPRRRPVAATQGDSSGVESVAPPHTPAATSVRAAPVPWPQQNRRESCAR